MTYEKAKAEIISFEETVWLTVTSVDGNYPTIGQFIAEYLKCGWFACISESSFECRTFSGDGTYHFTVRGEWVSVKIDKTSEFTYSCQGYNGGA